MDQKRITDYINSLDQGHGVLCDKIAKEARAAAVPIIRRETGALLQTLTAAVKPMRILEVGTAVGYSALLMAQSMPSGAHITTIEKYQPRIVAAKENFRLAGMEDAITLMEGDADKVLEQLSGTFDFIFMDPPYRMDLPKKVLEALKDTCLADEETLIIAEEALDVDFSWAGALGYEIVKIKEYKTNKHVFLKVKEV